MTRPYRNTIPIEDLVLFCQPVFHSLLKSQLLIGSFYLKARDLEVRALSDCNCPLRVKPDLRTVAGTVRQNEGSIQPALIFFIDPYNRLFVVPTFAKIVVVVGTIHDLDYVSSLPGPVDRILHRFKRRGQTLTILFLQVIDSCRAYIPRFRFIISDGNFV